MVKAIVCTIELWMHLRGLLTTQEAIESHLVQLLRFFRAKQHPACIHNSIVHAMAFTICQLISVGFFSVQFSQIMFALRYKLTT